MTLTVDVLAGFPSPPTHGIDLPGPFFIAFYSLAILTGIVLALLVSVRLWKTRGGVSDDIVSATAWAVVAGIIGARIYHIISTPDSYFGEGIDPLQVFRIWEGGISIIGAVMGGAAALYYFCRRQGIYFGALADTVVPGVLLAQAAGRWGNWFNQELYGRPTTLPWGLSINTDQRHMALPPGASESTLFHPTFLYESLWNILGFVVLLWLFKRFQFKRGLLAWTYVAYYALGRFWVESLRIDEFAKSTQFPLAQWGIDWRFNQIAAFVIFLVAIAILLWLYSKRPRTAEALQSQVQIYTPEGLAAREQIAAGHTDPSAGAEAEAAASSPHPGGEDGPEDSATDGNPRTS